MRLLHASTIRLHEFPDNAIPPYAILSHTWEGDEVSFQDMQAGNIKEKEGYIKIKFACEQAIVEKLKYVWVDTCCIDKSSSSELSEAINSMFQWYKNAGACYVYLVDVSAIGSINSKDSYFRRSRWFTRGWTLQELIAPTIVSFYSKDWTLLGMKHNLTDLLSEITGIDDASLTGGDLCHASVAKRMSWASRRVTTRKEDIAYCLLGIFGVNMPMLYGEGEKAFLRLQEEIIKESDDQSLFAWGLDEFGGHEGVGILAQSPSYFASAGDILPCKIWKNVTPHSMTSKGLRIELPVHQSHFGSRSDLNLFYGILSCHYEEDLINLLEIPIRRIHESPDEYIRAGLDKPGRTKEKGSKHLQHLRSIYIHKSPPIIEDSRRDTLLVKGLDMFDPSNGLHYSQRFSHRLQEVYPPGVWNESSKILSLRSSGHALIPTALFHFSSKTDRDFLIIVEYIPIIFNKFTKFEYSRARCYTKPMPPGMSLQQVLRSETHYFDEFIPPDAEYVPSHKTESTVSVNKFIFKLRREEVMGIEMFVVDISLDSQKPRRKILSSLLGS